MHVLVLHERVAPDALPEARDTLVQMEAVSGALRANGHRVETLPLDWNLARLEDELARRRPDAVFNLVESLGGSDAGAAAPVVLLEARGVPFTGASSAALALSNDKLLAKRQLRMSGLPTPAWHTRRELDCVEPGRYIVKSVAEHASLGLDDEAVVMLVNGDEARAALARQEARIGRPCFLERFIDGRELNVSVLENESGLEVLPPAEIDFSAFAPGKPRLVGYAAKWLPDSFEYQHTPRRFDLPERDGALIDDLSRLALATLRAVHVSSYSRVDVRVDAEGPWILEVNANPCLSPDAGFAAALSRGNISYASAIERMLRAAFETRS